VSVVVLVPGLGDEVQALKAGIMEIADVFVANKADREGVDRVVAEIQSMLSLAAAVEGEHPEIVQTVAANDQGIDEVLAAVDAFRERAQRSGLLARKRRAHLRQEFEDTLQERLMRAVRRRVLEPGEVERTVDRLEARTLDPFAAADAVIERMKI
jgi:LAO/AO transport system kinase